MASSFTLSPCWLWQASADKRWVVSTYKAHASPWLLLLLDSWIPGVPKVHKENNQLEPNYLKPARCRTQEAVPHNYSIWLCMWYESSPITEAVQIGQQRISAAKKVTEQHKEVWLLWIVHYLTNCKTFLEAGRQQLVTLNKFDDLPSCIKFPKTGWLLTVYCLHVLLRIQQVKPLISTQYFGQILKFVLGWVNQSYS